VPAACKVNLRNLHSGSGRMQPLPMNELGIEDGCRWLRGEADAMDWRCAFKDAGRRRRVSSGQRGSIQVKPQDRSTALIRHYDRAVGAEKGPQWGSFGNRGRQQTGEEIFSEFDAEETRLLVPSERDDLKTRRPRLIFARTTFIRAGCRPKKRSTAS